MFESGWKYSGAQYNRKLNPVGRDGQIPRCVVCDSSFHWARDCPHSYENSEEKDKNFLKGEDEEIVHLSMFVGYASASSKDTKLAKLVEESRECAVIDTGCSATICGERWIDNYLQQLSEYQLSLVEERDSSATFTFGDGKTYKAQKRLVLPAVIGEMKASITTVGGNVPLLLSKQAMKSAKMTVNFEEDAIKIDKNWIPLKLSSSGHYMLPIMF